jgi:hypothetical protein
MESSQESEPPGENEHDEESQEEAKEESQENTEQTKKQETWSKTHVVTQLLRTQTTAVNQATKKWKNKRHHPNNPFARRMNKRKSRKI